MSGRPPKVHFIDGRYQVKVGGRDFSFTLKEVVTPTDHEQEGLFGFYLARRRVEEYVKTERLHETVSAS